MTNILSIAEFSRTPFGRNPEDGKFCGFNFRKNHLLPALKKQEMLTVNLNDVIEGYEYGSSFLHEAFGGLVQHEGLTFSQLKNQLKIEYEYSDIVAEIWDYIEHPEKYNK